MKEAAVAKIYAKAMFELASESGAVSRVAEEMQALSKTAGEIPNFYRAFLDEKVRFEKRRDTAREICRAAGIGRLTASLFKLLVERRLLKLFPAITQDFVRRLKEKDDIVSVKVKVANAQLAKDVKKGVQTAIEKKTGKRVECDVDVEPELVGGFVLKIGDLTFDASVKGRLEQMKEELRS